jgi:Flp pilus assembly protein TadG
MIRRLRIRRWGDRRGAAALEFAVLTPLLFAIMVVAVDWGLAMDQRLRLQTAARAGAQVAMMRPADTVGIDAAVRAAAPGVANLSVTAAAVWCECNGAAATCGATCAQGQQRFTRIEVIAPHTPFSPAGPTSVSGRVTLRLQ